MTTRTKDFKGPAGALLADVKISKHKTIDNYDRLDMIVGVAARTGWQLDLGSLGKAVLSHPQGDGQTFYMDIIDGDLEAVAVCESQGESETIVVEGS